MSPGESASPTTPTPVTTQPRDRVAANANSRSAGRVTNAEPASKYRVWAKSTQGEAETIKGPVAFAGEWLVWQPVSANPKLASATLANAKFASTAASDRTPFLSVIMVRAFFRYAELITTIARPWIAQRGNLGRGLAVEQVEKRTDGPMNNSLDGDDNVIPATGRAEDVAYRDVAAVTNAPAAGARR